MLSDFTQKKLERQYVQQIESWDWESIKAATRRNGLYYLGKVYNILPSQCYYTTWCSYPGEAEREKDTIFWEALERVADKHGLIYEHGECDPTDLFMVDPRIYNDREEWY